MAIMALFCGGAIVAKMTIVTSASCIDGATELEVAYGSNNPKYYAISSRAMKTKDVTIPDGFDAFYRTDDIAIVTLPTPLEYSDSIKNIDLYEDKTTSLDGVDGTVSGWGRYSDSSNAFYPILRHASAKIISKTECTKFFSADVVKDTNLCLDGKDGKGVCYGDMGGPLTVIKDGKVKLAGIASFVSPWGCTIGYPSVYTRISPHVTWIKLNMKDK